MKFTLILFTVLTLHLNAQIDLKFDKKFVECEDKWVAFQMNKDSSYLFGFIYIDEQAGLTLNNEGSFKVKQDNSLIVKKLTETSVKIRLEPNNVRVAIIPNDLYDDLQIKTIPEWLKYYKNDTNSVKRLFKWGYMYNGWNECSKGLSYLLRVKDLDSTYKGLNVEIAFSYNCLKEYNKAEQILKEELKLNPTDPYINKEYIYSVSKTNTIDKAVEQYFKSLETIKDKTYNAENCFNIMQFYYKNDDVSNFDIWYKELKKYKIENEMLLDYADKMKKELKK